MREKDLKENGLADMNDTNRKWWIEETIVAIERALSEDIEVIGSDKFIKHINK